MFKGTNKINYKPQSHNQSVFRQGFSFGFSGKLLS